MDFTKDELRKIDALYNADLQDATVEDLQLIIRWERASAVNDTLESEKIAAIRAESQARAQAHEKLYEQARDNLQTLHDLAVKRYEDGD